MKIIALQGKSNIGKTTTLKQMILTIVNNDFFNLEDCYNKEKIIRRCNMDKGDVMCVFDCNGVKIGITTRGDTSGCLGEDYLKHFRNCDIVVCAVHTYGGTVNFIKEKGADEVVIHAKWYVEANDRKIIDCVNLIQSNVLIKEVKRLANEREIK